MVDASCGPAPGLDEDHREGTHGIDEADDQDNRDDGPEQGHRDPEKACHAPAPSIFAASYTSPVLPEGRQEHQCHERRRQPDIRYGYRHQRYGGVAEPKDAVVVVKDTDAREELVQDAIVGGQHVLPEESGDQRGDQERVDKDGPEEPCTLSQGLEK